VEQHEFEIEILPDGKIRVHIKGVKGPACLEYAKLFEKVAGAAGEAQHTSEYYEPPTEVRIDLEQRTKN
jgi:hypothetical protein